MFSTSSHQHTYMCRLARQTIVMTISTNLCKIDISILSSQLYWYSKRADLSTHPSYGLSECNHHPITLLEHLPCTSITLSAHSYTHTLLSITRLRNFRMISSHGSIALGLIPWSTNMLSHISVQRIKVTNKSISTSRSICIAITLTWHPIRLVNTRYHELQVRD